MLSFAACKPNSTNWLSPAFYVPHKMEATGGNGFSRDKLGAVKNETAPMHTHKTKPHSKDLRKGRYSQNNQIYLVTTVTEKREPIFLDFALGRWVVQAMRRQQEQGKVQSLAFVVMPDHLHWLFALQNDGSLTKVMQGVKGISSYEIQKIRRGRGEIQENPPLWQEGYHDHAVRKEEDLQQLARYIVANPLRAGLVGKIGDYPLWDAIWL